jgi:hypothetical protein
LHASSNGLINQDIAMKCRWYESLLLWNIENQLKFGSLKRHFDLSNEFRNRDCKSLNFRSVDHVSKARSTPYHHASREENSATFSKIPKLSPVTAVQKPILDCQRKILFLI